MLDESIPFLQGRRLNVNEESYYDLPIISDRNATLYEHCKQAIEHGLRFGEHGLPLMGSGDWNDGMNMVGIHGKGESVWLAFFLFDDVYIISTDRKHSFFFHIAEQKRIQEENPRTKNPSRKTHTKITRELIKNI